MEHRRRQFLTEPGEPLILARSAMTIAERFSTFLAETGIDRRYVLSSPLVSIPLPMASKQAGPRGWEPGINPAALWHPLFWLPERVAYRYRFDDTGDGLDVETDNEWAVRVGLEATLSELYDPNDGTWLDILALHGLNIEDEQVQERIASWLTGAGDEVLDSIDLSAIVDLPDDLHWAVESTAELLPTLQPASWALLADDLAQDIGELTVTASELEPTLDAVETLVHLALGTLAEVPASVPGADAPAEQWRTIASTLNGYRGDVDSLINNELDALGESLYAIRDDYWSFVDALNEEITAEDADEQRAITA